MYALEIPYYIIILFGWSNTDDDVTCTSKWPCFKVAK